MYTLYPLILSLPSFCTRRRRLHDYPGGGNFVVCCRLDGSITRPAAKRVQDIIEQYGTNVPPDVYWAASAEERVGFRTAKAEGKYDRRTLNGPFHLHHNTEVRKCVTEAIHYREGTHWEVIAYTIMPNHLHLVVRHLHPTWHMGKVLQHFKRHTARQCNKILGVIDQAFWQEESFDAIVGRQADLRDHVNYVMQNPVVAGLATDWRTWPGNWVRTDAEVYVIERSVRVKRLSATV